MKIGRFEIKRVENTKWDFIIPLGLVLIASFYFIYYSWNCKVCYSGAKIIDRTELNDIIIYKTLALSIFVLVTLYLTRFKRIVFSLLVFLFVIAWFELSEPISDNILKNTMYSLALDGGFRFFFGVLALSLIYGNSPGRGGKKYGLKRSALGWGVLGIGLSLAMNSKGKCVGLPGVRRCPIIPEYDLPTRLIDYLSYYPLLADILIPFLFFVILGIAIERYNQKRGEIE